MERCLHVLLFVDPVRILAKVLARALERGLARAPARALARDLERYLARSIPRRLYNSNDSNRNTNMNRRGGLWCFGPSASSPRSRGIPSSRTSVRPCDCLPLFAYAGSDISSDVGVDRTRYGRQCHLILHTRHSDTSDLVCCWRCGAISTIASSLSAIRKYWIGSDR